MESHAYGSVSVAFPCRRLIRDSASIHLLLSQFKESFLLQRRWIQRGSAMLCSALPACRFLKIPLKLLHASSEVSGAEHLQSLLLLGLYLQTALTGTTQTAAVCAGVSLLSLRWRLFWINPHLNNDVMATETLEIVQKQLTTSPGG